MKKSKKKTPPPQLWYVNCCLNPYCKKCGGAWLKPVKIGNTSQTI